MPKGQVTDDELATGLKGFGSLSTLSGSARPVRDNPFRDTRTESAQPVVPVPPPEASPMETGPQRIEVLKIQESLPAEGRAGMPASAPAFSPKPREGKPPSARTPKLVTAMASAPKAAAVAEIRETKTDLYAERVTVPLSAELRDGAESVAKVLQRRRTEKGERITSNTVIRVALRVLLECFGDNPDEVANNEEELFELVRKNLGRT
jgi:hypothetical protein